MVPGCLRDYMYGIDVLLYWRLSLERLSCLEPAFYWIVLMTLSSELAALPRAPLIDMNFCFTEFENL